MSSLNVEAPSLPRCAASSSVEYAEYTMNAPPDKNSTLSRPIAPAGALIHDRLPSWAPRKPDGFRNWSHTATIARAENTCPKPYAFCVRFNCSGFHETKSAYCPCAQTNWVMMVAQNRPAYVFAYTVPSWHPANAMTAIATNDQEPSPGERTRERARSA